MAREEEYSDDDAFGDSDGAVDPDRDTSQASGEDVARATGASDGRMVYAGTREGDDTWLTRGLAGMLLVTGAVLFLFPEPATSMLGIGLIVAGLVAWVLTSPR